MPGLNEAAQGRGGLLAQVAEQLSAAHGAVGVQVVQHGDLAGGGGAHGPGRVHAQQAEFFAGRVRARRQQAGRVGKQGLGQLCPGFLVCRTQARQRPDRCPALVQAVQAHARLAQAQGQHMPQNTAGR